MKQSYKQMTKKRSLRSGYIEFTLCKALVR